MNEKDRIIIALLNKLGGATVSMDDIAAAKGKVVAMALQPGGVSYTLEVMDEVDAARWRAEHQARAYATATEPFRSVDADKQCQYQRSTRGVVVADPSRSRP